MNTFRLVIVDRCRETQCIELQKQVTNEAGNQEWIHYCVLASVDQAIPYVELKEPNLASVARKDLSNAKILDSQDDRSLESRVAKHLQGWKPKK